MQRRHGRWNGTERFYLRKKVEAPPSEVKIPAFVNNEALAGSREGRDGDQKGSASLRRDGNCVWNGFQAASRRSKFLQPGCGFRKVLGKGFEIGREAGGLKELVTSAPVITGSMAASDKAGLKQRTQEPWRVERGNFESRRNREALAACLSRVPIFLVYAICRDCPRVRSSSPGGREALRPIPSDKVPTLWGLYSPKKPGRILRFSWKERKGWGRADIRVVKTPPLWGWYPRKKAAFRSISHQEGGKNEIG